MHSRSVVALAEPRVGVAIVLGSFVSLFAVGCAAGRARSENAPGGAATTVVVAPSSSVSTTSSSSAPTTSTTTTTTTTPPPDRIFAAGANIVVKKLAPAPAKRFIVKQAKFMGASADAQSFVAETLGGNLLITATNPKGVRLDNGVLVSPGEFTSDGKLVAVFYQGGLDVFASPSGTKVVPDAAPNPCAFRWISDHVLLSQQMNTSTIVPEVQLYRVDAAAKTSTALGPKRKSVDTCAISPDGAHVLVSNYAYTNIGSTVTLYDVAKGTSVDLIKGVGATWKDRFVLSPTADRICFWRDTRVWCMRVNDRGVEQIAEFDGKTYSGVSEVEIEETGKRMMIMGAEEVSPQGPTATWHLVDFASGTVRRVVGVKTYTGSIVRLFPEGHLLVTGSATGVFAIDLDAATRTFVPNAPFYAIDPIPGRPRAIVAGAEPGGGGAMEDLYVFDVP